MAPSVSRITPLAEASRGSTVRDEAGGSIGGFRAARSIPPRARLFLRRLQEFVTCEKIRAFDSAVVDRIGAVDGIFADVATVQFSNAAFRGFRRVGSAYYVAVMLHGIFAFECGDRHGASGHEGAELVEKGSFTVN